MISHPMTGGVAGGGRQNSDIGLTMDAGDAKKKGNLGLTRGGQYAKQFRMAKVVRAGPLEWRLDTEMADAFAGIAGEDGTVPSKGLYAIRDRSQHPWRVLARRFREAREANAPLDQALAPIRVLETWVKGLYGDQAFPKRAA